MAQGISNIIGIIFGLVCLGLFIFRVYLKDVEKGEDVPLSINKK